MVLLLIVKIMKIIRKIKEKTLIESFKQEFKKIALKNEQNKKRLSFVLTGGPSPIKLYKELSKLNINWKNVDKQTKLLIFGYTRDQEFTLNLHQIIPNDIPVLSRFSFSYHTQYFFGKVLFVLM